MLVAAIKASVIVVAALAATRVMRRRSARTAPLGSRRGGCLRGHVPLLGLIIPSWHVDLGIGSTVPAPTATSDAPRHGEQRFTHERQRNADGHDWRDRRKSRPSKWCQCRLSLSGLRDSLPASGFLIVGVGRLRWLESRSRPWLPGHGPG